MPTTIIDLRSDTFTVPDASMRAAMARADVGDDVWGEDPTVNHLEAQIAQRLGKQAAVFVPSGTMGNLAAVAAQTRPGDEVIVDAQAHIFVYEVAGSAVVAGVQLRTLDGFEGMPDVAALEDAIRGEDIHKPISRLFCVENTHNRRGGAAVDAERIRPCADLAHDRGLRVHCDGARLFNAAVAFGCTPASLVASCDTVSVCFSKGLGAPVGSAVVGDAAFIDEVRRWRKRLGGGMRQAGFLAAAALYALENNVERLAEDHANARHIAGVLQDAGVIVNQATVPTNMVLVETPVAATEVAARASDEGVRVTVMGPRTIRCVTHIGVSEADSRAAAQILARVLSGHLSRA
ncbi:MAG TPA: GntG family PLP-dependent aldolase [Steroidobacteraceae bacterium]|nr:GntG family PLP-dependent aldolase [Steroidobacteraceae bacterium]